MRTTITRRMIAAALAVTLLLTQVGIPTVAYGSEITPKTVTAFAPLTEDVQNRILSIGDGEEALNLPKTVAATVETTTYETPPVADNGEDGNSPAEPPTVEPVQVVATSEEQVAVTWECDGDITAPQGGNFTYTAKLADSAYTLAAGVAMPEIYVMVGAAVATPLAVENTFWTDIASITPEGAAGKIRCYFRAITEPENGQPGTAIVQPDSRYSAYTVIDAAFAGTVTIPEIVTRYGGNQYTVIGIGTNSFDRCKVSGVTLPESITSIDSYAFYGCASLKSVNIPEGVETIGLKAFLASGLTEVTIPSTVKRWGAEAFYSCKSLTDVTIAEGVTDIGAYAFSGCAELVNASIPNSITSFGERAFQDCAKLSNINIPAGVTSIGTYAFSGCASFTTVTIPELEAIPAGIFSGCKLLTEITIPESVTSIGGSAFGGCRALSDINIPAGVTSIGGGAFANCVALTDITIPSSVDYIGSYAFDGCVLLNNIVIPDGVTIIYQNTFSNCKAFTEIVIPEGVTSIGYDAFSDCKLLKTVTIPSKLEEIKDRAFSGCSSLAAITLPKETLHTIGMAAFSSCTSLQSITIPESVTTMYTEVFAYSGLTSVTIPKTIVNIGKKTFYNCNQLLSVTISEGVKTIGESAFEDCDLLATVSMPDSLKTIGMYAFTRSALTELTIPKGVGTIMHQAFYPAHKLEKVTFLPTQAPFLSQAFGPNGPVSSQLYITKEGIGYGAWNDYYKKYVKREYYINNFDLNTLLPAPKTGEAMPKELVGFPQYYGSVTWSPTGTKFLPDTDYVATVNMTASPHYNNTVTPFTHSAPGASITNEKTSNGRDMKAVITFSQTEPKALKTIEVTTPPNKTEYNYKEKFDPTGMVVKAYYNTGDEVADFKAYTVDTTTPLNVGVTSVILKATANTNITTKQDITVKKVDSEIGLGISKTDIYYGDSFNISFTPKAASVSGRSALPISKKADLYLDDTLIMSNSSVIEGQTVTFPLSTSTMKDKFPASVFDGKSHTFTVKWGGDDNLNGVEESATATLSKKVLSATVATTEKTYDGKTAFTAVPLVLSNPVEGDIVTATADGDGEFAKVGTHVFTASSIALAGADADYYSLQNDDVAGNVTVNEATPTVTVTATVVEKKSLLRSIIGNWEDTFVLKAVVTGVNGEKPAGNVIFKNGTTEIGSAAVTNDGIATFDWVKPTRGTYTITAVFTPTDANYESATATSKEYEVTKAQQAAFTIDPVEAKKYGDPAFTLSVKGGSGTGRVIYEVDAEAAVSVNPTNGEVTILGIGTATVTANKSGDDNYNSIANTVDIIIGKATPTLTWGEASQTLTYTGAKAVIIPPTIAGVSGGTSPDGTITYQYKSTATKLTNLFGLLEGYSEGLPTDAGEYKIIATMAESGNYVEADSAEMTLTINKFTPTISINTMNGKTYDGKGVENPKATDMTLNQATYGDLTFVYSKNSDMSAPLVGMPKNAGIYYVQASVEAKENTEGAKSAAVEFTIKQALLTVTTGIVTPRQYDRGQVATVSELTFSGLKNDETLELTTDYTVGSPVYDSADVGTDKTVTGTATLVANAKTENYSLTGDYSITEQTISKMTGIEAPSFVAMDDSSATKSFTFGKVAGFDDVTAYEWRIQGDLTWTGVTADPITFGNRAGNMEVRVADNKNYEAGAIYTHLIAFTSTLEGSAAIEGTATYGETLTAKTEGTQLGAELHYQWRAGDINIGTDSKTLAIPGMAVGKVINVEVTAKEHTGMLISSPTAAVGKKAVTATAGTVTKQYDGTAEATVSLSIDKVNVEDEITVTAPNAVYNDEKADTDKAIILDELAVTGAARGWYEVTAPMGVTGTITVKPLTSATVKVSGSYPYTGIAITPEAANVTVMDGGNTLTEGSDYTFSASDNINVGTATVNVTFIGNYSGNARGSFTITPKAITPTVNVTGTYSYTGVQIKPTFTVKDGTTDLADTDYTTSYGENIKVGTNAGSVHITLKGNYSGTATASFNIDKAAKPTVAAPATFQMREGKEKAHSFDLSTLVMPGDAGAKSYTVEAPGDAGLFSVTPEVDTDGKTLNFTSSATAPVGAITTAVVTIASDNYADATVTLTFEIISKIPVTITGLKADTGLIYNGNPQKGYSGTPVVDSNFVPVGELVYTYSGVGGTIYNGATAPTNPGDYKLVVSVADSNDTYVGAHNDILFTIGKASQDTLTIDPVNDKKYGDPAVTLTTKGGSGTGAVTYSVPDDNGVLTISDDKATIIGTGTVLVTATMAEDGNYQATSATLSVTIGKAEQSGFTINGVTGKKFDGGTFTLSTTGGNGGGTVSYSVSTGNGVLTIAGDTATIVGVGTVLVTATKAADGNYNGVTATQLITIDKADMFTVSYPTAENLTYGQMLSASTWIGDSTTGGSFAWETPSIVPTVENAGYNVTFTPSTETVKNYKDYSPKTSMVRVIVEQATPAMTLQLKSITGNMGDRTAIFEVEVSKVGSGEVPTGSVELFDGTTSLGTATALVDGKATITWTVIADKNYSIKASYSGSGNYKSVDTTIPVDTSKKNQENFALASIGSKSYGDTEFTLSTTGGNGEGEVRFASSNPEVVNIVGTQATIVGAGDVIITATKDADSAYNAVTTQTSLTVGKRTASVKVQLSKTSLTQGEELPTASLVYDRLVGSDSLTPKTAPTFDGMPADSNTAGSHTIIWSNKAAMQAEIEALAIAANYSITYTETASFTISEKSSGDGDIIDDGGSVTTPVTPPAIIDKPAVGNANSNVTVDENGKGTSTIDDNDITNAIDQAQKDAKENGTEQNGIVLNVELKGDEDANSLSTTISEKALNELIAAGVTSITISGTMGDITLDLEALKAIAAAGAGDVTIEFSKSSTENLSQDAQNAVGNRPVFDIKVMRGGKVIESFGKGQMSVSFPYTLQPGETAGNVQAVYIDQNGNVEWLTNSSYDPITNTMRFSTNHNSLYGVGYKQAPKFTDIDSHWAKNDIHFVVGRGLLNGTGGTTFAPNLAMTRGMFVTAIGRLAGVDTKKYENTKFTDVKADAYYAPYVAWASENNIVNGTSATTFAPDQNITREQMAVIMQGYAKAIGYELPSVHVENTFADNAKISGYAKDAVKQMQMAGVLTGKEGNLFDPQGTATRAEVSAVLRRFVELCISTDTAQGWMQNDSGKWMYYENGKPVTGQKTINGVSYSFDPSGVMADMPKNLTYTAYTVKAGDSWWKIAKEQKCNLFELAKVNGKTIFTIMYAGDVLQIPNA